MDKSIRTALIAGVVVLLTAGIVYQDRVVVKKHKEAKEEAEQQLTFEESASDEYKRRADKLQVRNDELTLENEKLVRENKELKAKVKVLNNEIKELNKTIQKQAAIISTNENEMKKLREESASLVERVNRLQQTKGADDKLIEQLDLRRQELDKKVGELYMENVELENQALDGTKELAKLTEQYDEKERTLQIVENVQVDFSGVFPRRDETRRARNVKQWQLTIIDMKLNADDAELIKGETFIVKILDKATAEVLPPREASGSTNDTQGETFVFETNPIPTIKYSNYQEKKGKNYILQVYYVKDGKNYPLRNGSIDISFKRNPSN